MQKYVDFERSNGRININRVVRPRSGTGQPGDETRSLSYQTCPEILQTFLRRMSCDSTSASAKFAICLLITFWLDF
jgi:hypothetical protein